MNNRLNRLKFTLDQLNEVYRNLANLCVYPNRRWKSITACLQKTAPVRFRKYAAICQFPNRH